MITCEHCRHFQPDTVNPVSGMGRCLHLARHGFWHPDAPHVCRDREEREPDEEPRADE